MGTQRHSDDDFPDQVIADELHESAYTTVL
jgi:hypothetical protein